MSLIVQEKELCVIEVRYHDHRMVQNGSIATELFLSTESCRNELRLGKLRKEKLERRINSEFGERQRD